MYVNPKLLNPKSIAVVGASENTTKPGGKVLENLLLGKYTGDIFAVNPKRVNIEGVQYVETMEQLPQVDLAILAIPAAACVQTVEYLAARGTGGFILFSAGFSEAGPEGIEREKQLVDVANKYDASLIGPNCVGIINENYKGVFTTPVPDYDPHGCELISSSGATAVFIMEAARRTGLTFSNVYSIGNAAHTGVEDILEHLDETFDSESSPKVKLLYLENIRHPFRFMKHAASLIRKGCHIATIKSGYSEAGGRAASSHTGAMATSDAVIRAMFKKSGIVYCGSREELISVACVWQNRSLGGNNMAIITHAGGSAVMLTDALTGNGMNVPLIPQEKGEQLLKHLHPGSSVTNPIDFLATGTAEQLGHIIDFCEDLADIDGMVVVFGSPGLFNVADVYEVLNEKMKVCKKPIYPVLPSLVNAAKEIETFVSRGRVNFSDEVVLGYALANAYHSPKPTFGNQNIGEDIDVCRIRNIISDKDNGYLNSANTRALLEAAGIRMAKQRICNSRKSVAEAIQELPFPVVMKVEGPVHKTDVGGVSLNINSEPVLLCEFDRMMKIPEAKGVLIQEMAKGEELYCGAVRNSNFGHLVMCGLGGIFVEILQDTAHGIAPLHYDEAKEMIKSLKGYPIIKGYRGRPGVNEAMYIDAVVRISSLVHVAPEISEIDINPFMGNESQVIAVDARVRIER